MLVFYLILGLIYTNFLEWFLHKYLLHGLGKNKLSKFSFHMVHHKVASMRHMKDSPSLHEAFYLVLISLAHIWLIYISPWLYCGSLLGGILYWAVHTKAHLDPDWMLKWVFWHYAHHTWFPDSNWCVTYPLFDILLGTYRND